MPRRRSGWRALGLFWLVLLMLGGAGAAALQAMGPMPRAPAAVDAPPAPREAPPVAQQTRRVLPPDPALLERSAAFPPAQLPRVAPDGRAARSVYAAPTPPVPAGAPRIAVLMSGFGLSEKDSAGAVDALPGPVSFAASAYSGIPPAVFEAARAAGHELLVSVPMEPAGYPLNDAGARSLLTGLSPADNRQNLEWALGRIPGAVGATAASDGMRGERFADVSGALDPILDEIGRRGLLYIDPRPGRVPSRPGLPGRAIDLVLDESPARAEIEAKLLALERIARERGSAVGLVGPPRPVTIERIAAWAQTLEGKGIVLVPVSALVPAP